MCKLRAILKYYVYISSVHTVLVKHTVKPTKNGMQIKQETYFVGNFLRGREKKKRCYNLLELRRIYL